MYYVEDYCYYATICLVGNSIYPTNTWTHFTNMDEL